MIKHFKWCFVNASIEGVIDCYFSDSHIVRPVLSVFVQQICMNDLTNGAIHVLYLTISLRIVSKCALAHDPSSFYKDFRKSLVNLGSLS